MINERREETLVEVIILIKNLLNKLLLKPIDQEITSEDNIYREMTSEDIYHAIRLAKVNKNAAYAAVDYFEKIAPLCEKYPDIAYSLMRIAIRPLFYCGLSSGEDVLEAIGGINRGNSAFLAWLEKNEWMVTMIVKELTVCCFLYDLKYDKVRKQVILEHRISKRKTDVFVEISDKDIFVAFSSFKEFRSYVRSLYCEYDLNEDEIDRLMLEEDYEGKYFSKLSKLTA